MSDSFNHDTLTTTTTKDRDGSTTTEFVLHGVATVDSYPIATQFVKTFYRDGVVTILARSGMHDPPTADRLDKLARKVMRPVPSSDLHVPLWT